MYPDEISFYVKRIQRDSANERLTDLAIVHNPNSKEPKKLFTAFQNLVNRAQGKDYLSKERMTKEDEANLKEVARQMRANARKRRG